jgi:1-acyl-sn-glycerol-3-phosphate acyltransferase
MAIDDRAAVDRGWARAFPARVAREAIICGLFDAIIHAYARVEVSGREQLDALEGPVIFVANHCSHVDTPLLLRALPGRWRRRTAVTAAADYFYTSRLLAGSVSLAFGTVPLQRRNPTARSPQGGGNGAKPAANGAAAGANGAVPGANGAAPAGRAAARGATDAVKPLIARGWSLVVYPEGSRSRDGRVHALRVGAAALAAEHGLPIVPIHISGTHVAMPVGQNWMCRPAGGRFARHTLRVAFGAPIAAQPDADVHETMEQVRRFMASCGADTTPDPKLVARQAEVARALAPQPAVGEPRVPEADAVIGAAHGAAAGRDAASPGAQTR